MKYEQVFGDQSLFNGAPDDAEIAAKFEGGIAFFPKQKPSSKVFFVSGVELAMRRIIAEPKRWTVEDQKAGRLPEVGVIVKETAYKSAYPVELGDGYECKIIGVYKDEVCLQFDDGSMRIDSIKNIEPIESPEEKAERLRSEWINKAYVDFHRLGCELEVLQKEQIKQIYDALLSGDLTAPGKE